MKNGEDGDSMDSGLANAMAVAEPPETVSLSELPPEERREILKQARAYTQTKNLARAQARSAVGRKRKPGKLHRKGSHWYELESYFDPALIESTPVEDSGFMMGVLEDFVVVEVKEDTPHVRIESIGKVLAEIGVKALIVRAGIRFLRLKSCDGDQEAKLNAILAKQQEGQNGKSTEPADGQPPRDDSGS